MSTDLNGPATFGCKPLFVSPKIIKARNHARCGMPPSHFCSTQQQEETATEYVAIPVSL